MSVQLFQVFSKVLDKASIWFETWKNIMFSTNIYAENIVKFDFIHNTCQFSLSDFLLLFSIVFYFQILFLRRFIIYVWSK